MFIDERPSSLMPLAHGGEHLAGEVLLALGASFLRRTERPQKVKNIVTGLPVATAPFARTNEARALSRSLEKTIRSPRCPGRRSRALPRAIADAQTARSLVMIASMIPSGGEAGQVVAGELAPRLHIDAEAGSLARTVIWSPPRGCRSPASVDDRRGSTAGPPHRWYGS